MALLGYRDAGAFRAWRRRAQAMGFPSPLPGRVKPMVWSRAQIDAWLAAGGRPALAAARQAQAPAADTPPLIDELAAARARLAARSQR
jgi:hypothetical protein